MRLFEDLACFGLSGRTALVTGAGSGLGREIAVLFARVGAKVVITDLVLETAEATAALCDAENVHAVQMDVSDEGSVLAAFDAARKKFGPIDVLVNNAAYRPKAETMAMPIEQWDKMHAVNTRGAFICLRQAVLHMRERGGGSVVNVSSMSAVHPTIFPNMHYDSSKAGLGGITRLAAVEFAPDKIRVNAILPGGMDTKGGSDIRAAAVKIAGPAVIPGRNPTGRMAQPIEMARAVLFLASDAASYITGVELLVDGGFCVG